MTLPTRVQEELLAAEALEAADKAAREASVQSLNSAADLIVPQQPQFESAPQQAPAPAAPTAQVDDSVRQEYEALKQKYKTLQGIYNADSVAMRQQLSDLAGQVQSLTSARQVESQPAAVSVDPKDIESFGEEMMSMVQRYVTGAVKVLESRIAQLETTVNGVAAKATQTQEKQFYDLLTKLVPNWRAVNTEDRWLEWLGVEDDVYGVPRQAALDNAFKAGDAQRVANVFTAYLASQPKPASNGLAGQVAPSGAGNPVAPTAVAKPIISQKAINDFFRDVALDKYVGREQEAAAIEHEINVAVAENRVR